MASPGKLKAMISSTALDLPEHRPEAITACLRAGVFPIAMEHLPATDADAIAESLRIMSAGIGRPFSDLIVSMMRAGEMSGKLSQVLEGVKAFAAAGAKARKG